MKVFGIGMHKTGTTTLAECLSKLGFRHHYGADIELHRAASEGDLEPVFEVADEYDSFEDWPWPFIYEELDDRYPDARFILTTRKDSATWLDSLKRHAENTGPTEHRVLAYGYSVPHGHETEHVHRYEQHNQEVREYFRDRNDFLEVCWEREASWDKLCRFLDKPVPDRPFPHANRRPKSLRETSKMIFRRVKWTLDDRLR